MEEEGEDTPGATPAKRRSVTAPASASVAASGQAKRIDNVFAPAATGADTSAAGTPSRHARQSLSARAHAHASPTKAQRASGGTPRKSLPAHMYLASIGQSPAKSPMLRKMIGASPMAAAAEQAEGGDKAFGRLAEESAEGTGGAGYEIGNGDADFEPATVPLAAFLHTAGIEFVQDDVQLASLDLRRGAGRQSMARQTYGTLNTPVQPVLRHLLHPLGEHHTVADRLGERDFALHEYTAASIQNLFVNMYIWVSLRFRFALPSPSDRSCLDAPAT